MLKIQLFIFKFLFCKKLSMRPWVKPALVSSPVNWRLVPSSLRSLYFFLRSSLDFSWRTTHQLEERKFNGHQEKKRRKNEDREGRKGGREKGGKEGGKKPTLRHSSYWFSFTRKLEEKLSPHRAKVSLQQWSICLGLWPSVFLVMRAVLGGTWEIWDRAFFSRGLNVTPTRSE